MSCFQRWASSAQLASSGSTSGLKGDGRRKTTCKRATRRCCFCAWLPCSSATGIFSSRGFYLNLFPRRKHCGVLQQKTLLSVEESPSTRFLEIRKRSGEKHCVCSQKENICSLAENILMDGLTAPALTHGIKLCGSHPACI